MLTDAMAGRRIGPYQIVRLIGSGGMGSVYLANRVDEIQKQVAIKLVPPGMYHADMLDRFRLERTTLAGLDHPNIVRLVDGGATDDGAPYLVMDYVEGIPITEYCDQRKLSITQRLILFRQVCSAVQYAHQNLIVHRDIKPANILVTSDGAPKLLDFGVAKLLKGGQTAQNTEAGKRTLTLRYASPEQVRGQPVTIAVDVYSLGVLLYELLTGRIPFAAASSTEIALAYAICELEPDKPSQAVLKPVNIPADDDEAPPVVIPPEQFTAARGYTPGKLRKRLEGDLDNVVLTAMRKEVSRRYPTVADLAGDIRRHQQGLPVLARPATPTYRASKFVMRHKGAVAVAALMVLIIAGAVFGIVRQYRIAERERAIAQRRYNDVRGLVNSFLFEIYDSVKDVPGATATRLLLVEKASGYLLWLAKESQGDAGLQLEMADAYIKLAGVQGNPYQMNLGKPNEALASYAKALAVAEPIAQKTPNDLRARRYAALARMEMANVQASLGQLKEAIENLRSAASLFEALAAAQPNNLNARVDLARCYDSMGDVLGHPGAPNLEDRKGAREAFKKALGHWEMVRSVDFKNPSAKRALAILSLKMAEVDRVDGMHDSAMTHLGKADEIVQGMLSDNPRDLDTRRLSAILQTRTGHLLAERSDYAAAIDRYRNGQKILNDIAERDPNDARARVDLAAGYKNIGEAQQLAGEAQAALLSYGQAVDLVEKLVTADPANWQRQEQYAELLILLGQTMHVTGQKAEARRQTQHGLNLARLLADRSQASAATVRAYAETLVTCLPEDLRNPAEALRYAERAVRMTSGKDARSLDAQAQVYYALGDTDRAIEAEEKAVALMPAGYGKQRMDGRLVRFKGARMDVSSTVPAPK